MATPVLARPSSEDRQLVASPWHTLILLLVQFGLAIRGAMQARQFQRMANPDRMRIYERTILFEWLVFGLMVAGVSLSGTSLHAVLGERWRTVGKVLRDLGIGVLFLIATITVHSRLGVDGHAVRGKRPPQFPTPHGPTEMTGWIVLSLTAGFCEEAIY